MIYFMQAGITLVQFVFGIYLVLVMLRFLLQWAKADFYNPISQAIVKVTNPPLRILRRFIPGFAGIDWPSIVLLILVQALEIFLLNWMMYGSLPTAAGLIVLTIAKLIQLLIFTYIVAIFVMVIISWLNPGAYNPITIIIQQLTEPIMRPVRRLIPSTGGLDWSPMVVLLLLYLSLTLIVAPLMDMGNYLSGFGMRLP